MCDRRIGGDDRGTETGEQCRQALRPDSEDQSLAPGATTPDSRRWLTTKTHPTNLRCLSTGCFNMSQISAYRGIDDVDALHVENRMNPSTSVGR